MHHSTRCNILILVFLIAAGMPVSSNSCFAQNAKIKGGNLRATIEAWDTNKNGKLEKKEIPTGQQKKVAAWAAKKGIDPGRPVSIRELFGKSSKESTKSEKLAKRAAKKAAKNNEAAKSNSEAKSSVNEFGADSAGSSLSGAKKTDFGERLNDTGEKSKAAGGKGEGKGGEEKEKKDDLKRGARFAARSVMYQNDANKNKRLERSEWKLLKGDPSKADRNKDNVLTLAELTDHLVGYGSREEKPQPKYRERSARKGRAKTTSRPTYRFLTPHERLPDGLPDWFVDRDTNRDGQLSLREYAPSLTRAKYEKFSQLDRNNDGLLVAKEYLAATE